MKLYAPPRESPVETYLVKQCRKHGLLCLKFTSPARSGVPDRVIISPAAGTVFVEVKRPGATPEPHQVAMHAKLRRFGGEVYVVDTQPGVDALIATLVDPLAHAAPAQPQPQPAVVQPQPTTHVNVQIRRPQKGAA